MFSATQARITFKTFKGGIDNVQKRDHCFIARRGTGKQAGSTDEEGGKACCVVRR